MLVLGEVMLEVAKALVGTMVPKVAKQTEGRVEDFETPSAVALLVEVSELRAAPSVDCGSVSNALLLISERLSAFGARKMNQLDWGRRRRAQFIELVDSDGIKNAKTISEVALSDNSNVGPAGFDVEGAVDDRAPPLRTIKDEIKNLGVGFWATICESAKQSNVRPNQAMPRGRQGRGNLHEGVQIIRRYANKASEIT